MRCNRFQAGVFGIVLGRPCVHSAGHAKQVVQLGGTAAAPALLASLSRDGELRTWDVARGACTSASASQACSLVRHGSSISRFLLLARSACGQHAVGEVVHHPQFMPCDRLHQYSC